MPFSVYLCFQAFRMTFHAKNFHSQTFCVFTEQPLSALPKTPEDFKSKSGSRYYFTTNGVYRLSDHWGRAARCKWRLEALPQSSRGQRLGYANWTDFHPDNDWEKLYFIVYDAASGQVQFEHRDGGKHRDEALRTASETTARIRQIRQLLEKDAWLSYYEGNPSAIRESAIRQLIKTHLSFNEIRAGLK